MEAPIGGVSKDMRARNHSEKSDSPGGIADRKQQPEGSVLGALQAFFHRFYAFLLVATAFAISIMLLNCTKYVYVTYHFKFPIWLTATHMAMSWTLAAVSIHVLNLVPDRRVLDFREQIRVVVPFSLLGATSIACGNAALVFLYPSFHEMLQNTTPLWTVLCSVVFKDVRYNRLTYVALIPVTFGGMLCAIGEPSKFATIGLVTSLGAAVTRALRAIVQASLLRGQQPIDPLTLLYYSTPFNLAMFLVASALIEGPAPWRAIQDVPFQGQLFIALVAMLAALYNLFSFLMMSHMGAVLSMVVNNIKTPSVIVVSMLIFGNRGTVLQLIGFFVALGGVFAHKQYSHEIVKEEPAANTSASEVKGEIIGSAPPLDSSDCVDVEAGEKDQLMEVSPQASTLSSSGRSRPGPSELTPPQSPSPG